MATHNATKLLSLASQTKLTLSLTLSLTLNLTLSLSLGLGLTLTLTLAILNRNTCAQIVDTHKQVFADL